MIAKLLEAFFRHKLLLLLPPILIPGLVTPIAFMNTPPVYETAVSVWVDHPAYLDYKDGFNSWTSPAATQAARIGELLRTRAFLMDVAQRTPTLAPLVGNAAGETRISDTVGKSISFGSGAGDHLLVIRVQTSTAKLSYELSKAVVAAYQEKSAADQADQADTAIQFYQSRANDAQQQLTKATQDLRRYVTSRQSDPNQTSDTAPQSIPASLLDPRLAGLQSTVQQAQSDYNSAQSTLQQAQRDAVAAGQGQQFGFQVLDDAQMPTAPTSQVKKIIVYPIAAAVSGLALSAMLLVLLVASDRSVRSETDLPPSYHMVGMVPTLKMKRVPKQLRSSATRRAIGAVAGTALPAARGTR